MGAKVGAVAARKLASRLEKRLLAHLGGPTEHRAFIARYSGGVDHPARQPDEVTALRFLGHKIPAVRSLLKLEFDFLPQTDREKWPIWIELWRISSCFEIRCLVLMWLARPANKSLRRELRDDLLGLAPDVDNWPHSDALSSLLAEQLELDPKLLKFFKGWNRSENPWLRRQSIVGLYFYVRLRKKRLPAEQALALVEPLLKDPHFYVQRGVGWVLREIDQVDSKLQRKFVKAHLDRISPTAWFAATELYSEKDRKQLVQKRKLLRKSALPTS